MYFADFSCRNCRHVFQFFRQSEAPHSRSARTHTVLYDAFCYTSHPHILFIWSGKLSPPQLFCLASCPHRLSCFFPLHKIFCLRLLSSRSAISVRPGASRFQFFCHIQRLEAPTGSCIVKLISPEVTTSICRCCLTLRSL